VSHWLPFFFFSMPMGALADRVDPRRLIQFGLAIFVCVSLGWGYFFATDSLQIWEAMLLLVLHGCAGVFWQTPSQLLLHSLVEREDLQSAVRMSATARYLGVLVGPAIGGAMLVGLGPITGIFLNAFYFIPTIFWLSRAPYQREVATRAALRGMADVLQTLREIASRPSIVTVSLLAAAGAAFIGNSYQAQMPEFAVDLGHGDPGAAYSALLAADAAGALTGGFALEALGGFTTSTRTAILLALAWAIALGSFALTHTYGVALACLFVAGFFELSFSSMAQTVVQIEAPAAIRGRVLGVYAVASLGCRALAGITVGVVGALVGVHVSLAIAAGALFVVALALLPRSRRSAAT
jgi:MFS family permease